MQGGSRHLVTLLSYDHSAHFSSETAFHTQREFDVSSVALVGPALALEIVLEV